MPRQSELQKPGGLRRIRLGTRSSRLALAQAEIVRLHLAPFGFDCEIVTLDTIGDVDQSRPISAFATAGPFTDDIEAALLRHEIDIAVHSLKDMPLMSTPGLAVAAILERGDPRECIVARNGERFEDLPIGAIIGTSCTRRAAQIRYLRSDLRTEPIRGPVDDRIRQVRDGKFDAAILAVAGLYRSGLAEQASEVFSLSRFVPAPAQAALAIQVREDDVPTRSVIASLDHAPTREAVAAELRILAHFEGRNGITIAAFGRKDSGLHLRVRVLQIDGQPLLETVVVGNDRDSVALHAIHRIEEALVQRKAAV